MIRHRPADDPAAVQIHDGGQIEPALIGLDVGDIGEPDPVRRSGAEVALEQVRSDREVIATDTPRVLPCPCPRCAGRMIVIEVFARGCEPRWRPMPGRIDTS